MCYHDNQVCRGGDSVLMRLINQGALLEGAGDVIGQFLVTRSGDVPFMVSRQSRDCCWCINIKLFCFVIRLHFVAQIVKVKSKENNKCIS
jgi:hypothetical protein